MPQVVVEPFGSRDIGAAARLLAARHRRDRERLPMLADALTGEPACVATVEHSFRNQRAGGVVARLSGALVGFLFGEKMTLSPAELGSMWVPPHSISIGVDAHAVAGDVDATVVYRAMYAALAADWVKGGFFQHQVHVVPGDAEVQEAWVSLGFGRGTTAAVRDTGPVSGVRPAAVEIHQASPEDLAVVTALSDALFRFHSASPIFWPFLAEPHPAAVEHTRSLLSDPANAHFIAYDRGEAIGMQTFNRPGFTPPIVEPEGNIYLFEGVVDGRARSGGVGTALLAHSMDWARREGYVRCTLHFASANPSGAPFWLGHGFVPVEHQMARHVDERVLWANGW